MTTRLIQILALLFIAAPLAQAQTTKTSLDAVYSEEQATRGETFFRGTCGRCHAEDQSGHYPLLNTKLFIDRWREYPLDTLYGFIRDNMPPRREGDTASRIPDAAYLDIVAHILKMNGYPSGAKALTTDSVQETLLVGKEGRQGPPDNSVVMTTGCLAELPNGSWALTNAVAVTRNRKPEEVSANEKNAGTHQAPGNLTIRLTELDALPDFNPSQHKGHKMLAKGYLISQPNAQRINVTLIEMVAGACSQ